MSTDSLCQILDTYLWDPRQAAEAKAQKANTHLQRQRSQVKLQPIKQSATDTITVAMDDCADGADVEFLDTDD